MEHILSVRPTGKFPEKVENVKRWACFPGLEFPNGILCSIDTFLVVRTSLYQVPVGHRDVLGFMTKWNKFLPIRNSTFAPTKISIFFFLNGKRPPCQSPLVSNNLQKVTTYPKHQNFPSESLADWTSRKQPPPVRLQPLVGTDGFVISLCFYCPQSFKWPLEAWFNICVSYMTSMLLKIYKELLVRTWNYTYWDLEITRNKLSSIK